ncbi:cell division protein FtsQ/DivIB [Deinococcus cavernae]|uniref:cell division protein FtsQ/DivIB n=1 Tax=Deinococcus cavernae TaxID=2320857 RepID=UPI001F3B001F|nr:FtsQ-type POTRA domain-containing protein [Deinococcus cavernae]
MFRRAAKPLKPEPADVPVEGLDDEDFPDPFDTEFLEPSDVAEQMTELASQPVPEAEVKPVDAATLPARLRPASRVRPWVWWTSGGLALLLVGGLASWFALPIRQVAVTGNQVLTEAEVKTLAGLRGGVGWLYYGRGQARGLLKNPWVQSAVVTRQFPDSVSLQVTERRPFLQMRNRQGQAVLVAQDGRLLPWKKGFEKLPVVSGWGPERLNDAVLVAHALSRYTVQSVGYTPSGLTVKTAAGTVWSGDLKSLLKYAGSISMYPNQKINVYPWGVSVQ